MCLKRHGKRILATFLVNFFSVVKLSLLLGSCFPDIKIESSFLWLKTFMPCFGRTATATEQGESEWYKRWGDFQYILCVLGRRGIVFLWLIFVHLGLLSLNLCFSNLTALRYMDFQLPESSAGWEFWPLMSIHLKAVKLEKH